MTPSTHVTFEGNTPMSSRLNPDARRTLIDLLERAEVPAGGALA
jgi:hypothetical protein